MKSSVNRSSGRRRATLVFVAALAFGLWAVAPAYAVAPEWAAPTTFGTGAGPHDIALGDFNLDGIGDIAVPNFEGTTVSVLKGTAAGGFAAAVPVTVGDRPSAIVAADFNHDGALDLAVTNRGSDNVSVLLNNGSGGFSVTQTVAVGDRPMGIASGDFNRDGRPDLVVAVYGADKLSQLTNNGTGTFTATDIPILDAAWVLRGPRCVAVADFNGDGTDDVAATAMFQVYESWGTNNYWPALFIYSGDGAGGFTLPYHAYTVPDGTVQLEASDFNRDGIIDIVGAAWSDQVVWTVLPGHAWDKALAQDTIVDATKTLNADFFPIGFALGELTNPGLVDAVVSLPHAGVLEYEVDTPDMGEAFKRDKVSERGLVSLSDEELHPTVENAGAQAGAVALTDVNRDGALDTVSLDFDANKVRVLKRTLPVRNGLGYEPATAWLDNYIGEVPPAPALTADLNGDSRADVVTSQTLLMNTKPLVGDPFFTPVGFAFAGPPVCSGDFNRDGHVDIVAVDTAGATLQVYPGDGAGGLGAAAGAATGLAPVQATAGDLDNDGDLDLVSANSGAGTASVLLNNGSGVFAAHADYTAGASPAAVALADLDNDGDLDLLVANNAAGTVSVLLNNGHGIFAARTDFAAGASPQSLAVGDFDRNGRLDVAVGGAPNRVEVLIGNGSGALAAPVSYTVAAGSRQLYAANLSTDGALDLVASGGGPGPAEVTVLANNGLGVFTPGSSLDLFTGTLGGAVVADFDNDGVVDLAVGGPDLHVGPAPGLPDHTGAGAVHVVLSDTTGPTTTDVVPAWGDPQLYMADDTLPNRGWPEWINAPQPVQFTGGADTGAGYDHTLYKAPGKAEAVTASATLPAPANHTGDGDPTYRLADDFSHFFQSVDKVGNVQDRQVRPLGVDTIVPKASDNAPAGWTGNPATVFEFTIIDERSGGWQPDPHGIEIPVFPTFLDGGSTYWDGSKVVWRCPGPPDHSNDGVNTFKAVLRDDAGNVSPERTTNVRVDTRGPDSYALNRAVINYNGSPTLSYKVLDQAPNGGTADVTIQIKNSKGVIKKPELSFVNRKIGVVYSYSFWCKLPRGTYTYYVYATDTAGNKQVNLGSNQLVVK